MTRYSLPLLNGTLDPPVLREIMRLQSGYTSSASSDDQTTALEHVPPGDLVEIMALALGRDETPSKPNSRRLDWDGPGTDGDGLFYTPFALRHVPPKPRSSDWSDRPTVKKRLLLPGLDGSDRPSRFQRSNRC